MTKHKNSRGGALRILVGSIAVIAAAAGIAFASSGDKKPAAQAPTAETRQAAFESATTAGAALGDYPATPQALLADFWNAANRKDYARLVLLCPGSQVADFKRHYDKWTPSPMVSASEGKPHATIPGVTMYDVKVNFPGFPNKTIRMAVIGLPDGRPAVDGKNTIWW